MESHDPLATADVKIEIDVAEEDETCIKQEYGNWDAAHNKLESVIYKSDIALDTGSWHSISKRKNLSDSDASDYPYHQQKRTKNACQDSGSMVQDSPPRRSPRHVLQHSSEDREWDQSRVSCSVSSPKPLGTTSDVEERQSSPLHRLIANKSISGTVSVPVLVLERMFTALEELKQEVREQGKTLHAQQALLAKLVTQESVSPALPEGITFPVATLAALEELEKRLADPVTKRNMEQYLAAVGGDSPADATRRMLRKLIATAVALQFNMNGFAEKKCFRVLLLRGVVTAAVRRAYATSTEAEVESAIAKWFTCARDRDGGRKRRAAVTRIVQPAE